jgi:hypothetical protein
MLVANGEQLKFHPSRQGRHVGKVPKERGFANDFCVQGGNSVVKLLAISEKCQNMRD